MPLTTNAVRALYPSKLPLTREEAQKAIDELERRRENVLANRLRIQYNIPRPR